MLLNGKTLVVTGGNSGIGEAIVKAAAAQGANVVIDYIAHADETAEIVAEIEQLGGHAVGVQADVSRTADLHKMVRTAVDTYGRLDALLNNAGIETRAGILDTTEADYERVMAINLKSAFFGTQFAAKSSSPRATAASPSTSPRSTRIGRCPATSPTASPRAARACWPAPPASSSARTASASSTSAQAPSPPRSTSRPWTTLAPSSRYTHRRPGRSGIEIDEQRNTIAEGDADVSTAAARVGTRVIGAREDLEIARQVDAVLLAKAEDADPGPTRDGG